MNLRTLKVSEASKETGIPESALYKLLESGELAGNRTGNRWRISASALEAWINRKPKPAPVPETSAFEGESRFA